MPVSRQNVVSPAAARRARLLLLASAVVACGSSSGSGPEQGVLRVAGDYATAVSLTSSTCPGIAVQNMPTAVAHAPGATTLSLSHASLTYQGTVQGDGRFTTTPRTVNVPGEAHTLSIAGRFTTTGFDATVSVAVTRDAAPQACAYEVRWVGTKQGGANVIPGA